MRVYQTLNNPRIKLIIQQAVRIRNLLSNDSGLGNSAIVAKCHNFALILCCCMRTKIVFSKADGEAISFPKLISIPVTK